MNSRLETLEARRRALEARCESQRDDVLQLFARIEDRAARADRVVAKLRGFAPVIAVSGAVVLLALRPRRLLGIGRRALAIALFANSARQTFLGSRSGPGVLR